MRYSKTWVFDAGPGSLQSVQAGREARPEARQGHDQVADLARFAHRASWRSSCWGSAYRFGLRWPLALGILLAFHALGNAHEYVGHGGYVLGIQDERLTLAVALAAVALGLWHEKTLENDLGRHEVGFGQIYIVLGLFYANVCLWLLSIPHGDLAAVLAFSAACVAQIVLGARLHDGRFTGFGVVFLSIDIYTRLFEGFWDDISKGSFFLLCGAIAMGAGIALEHRARELKAGAGA